MNSSLDSIRAISPTDDMSTTYFTPNCLSNIENFRNTSMVVVLRKLLIDANDCGERDTTTGDNAEANWDNSLLEL